MIKYIRNNGNIEQVQQIDLLNAKLAEVQELVDANENAYNAMFDGLKVIADEDNPFSLTLPQKVRANMFYRFTDGKRYVAVQTGIVREENFSDMMELWDIDF